MNLLLHSGVFVERQYCSFAGVVHGQKSTDFIKTLWAAIGEPDSRFRKPTAQGRMIERVMPLDAVLDDRDFVWLGPAIDKRRHFTRHLEDRLDTREYPHLTFGDGPAKTIRYVPGKLPIGVQPDAEPRVFVYLVTHPSPMDFRLFLLRHIGLLRVLVRWTIRLLFPRQLSTQDWHINTPLVGTLRHRSTPRPSRRWSGSSPERKRLAEPGGGSADERYLNASSAYRTSRYRAGTIPRTRSG